MADAASDASCTAERLFAIVWETMADVIGTAATATLVRRSAKRIIERNHAAECVSVRRDGFEFRYTVPEHWRAHGPGGIAALQELARELSPLLVELTGPVVIRRLVASGELARCDVTFKERAANERLPKERIP